MTPHRLHVVPWLRRVGALVLTDWLAITIGSRIFAWRKLNEAELAHELAAGGVDIAMIDVRAMLRGPWFQFVGKRTMTLLEKRPTQETTVEHRQFPANCGFCFATKAS